MMEEKRVITLSNGGRYLLIHDIGELEEPGKRYFFAMGVTPDYDLDTEDTLFLCTFKENNEDIVTKVSENSDLYKDLSVLEVISTIMDNIPGYKEQLKEEIAKLEEESSI